MVNEEGQLESGCLYLLVWIWTWIQWSHADRVLGGWIDDRMITLGGGQGVNAIAEEAQLTTFMVGWPTCVI